MASTTLPGTLGSFIRSSPLRLRSLRRPAYVGVLAAGWPPIMAMLPDMLRRDRERWGMSVGEAGWRLGRDGRTYPALAGCCLPGRHGPAVPMSMPGPPMTTSTVVTSGTTVSGDGTCSTTSPYSSEEQLFHPTLPNRNPAVASSRRAAAWPPPSLPRPTRFGTDIWSARLPTAYPAENTPNKRTMATPPTSDRRIM